MPHGFLMFSRSIRRAEESVDVMARETAKVFAREVAPGRRNGAASS